MKDFNADYGPLKVYDQGHTDACFYFAKSLTAAAKVKAYTGNEPTWGGQPPGHWAPTGGWATQLSDGEHVVKEGASVNHTDHAAVTAALDSCGLLAVAIEMPDDIVVWDAKSLPVIHWQANDQHKGAHSAVAVGYTDDGVIMQSSWGLRYGYQGRVVLGWDWWDNFDVQCGKVIVDSYPEDGMPAPTYKPPAPTPTPQPVPAPTPNNPPAATRPPLCLIRRQGGSNVYAITGGLRSWIHSRTVIFAQGGSMADIMDKPANDPLWLVPLIGPVPPGGDI